VKEIWVGKIPGRKRTCLMLATDEGAEIIAYFRSDEHAQKFLDFADGLRLKRGAST
jgi:hypothetical protein